MTEQKKPTVEQLNDFRQLIKTAACEADTDKLNAFINEYDIYTQIYEENGMKGVKDAAGQVLVPAAFDEVCYTFADHFLPHAVPVIKDGKFAFAAQDGTGTLLSDFEYDDIVYTAECCYIVVKDDKKGLALSDGTLVIPAQMDDIYTPFNGLGGYEKDGKHGFSLVYEQLTTEAIFEDYEIGEDDYLIVIKDGVRGYVDSQAQFTTDEDERYFGSFCD